ncbi:MAG: hypothetical protein ACRBDL_01515 [Alphaproteobacteria bacterium]
MKRALIALMITMIALPAFLQVMPHGIDHALHQAKVHYAHNDHGHDHNDDHRHDAHEDDHHAINLDIVTFYDDYLHVDLQSQDHVALEQPVQDVQDLDSDMVTGIMFVSRYELSPVQSRAPPDWQSIHTHNTPLYLSTQRLRI